MHAAGLRGKGAPHGSASRAAAAPPLAAAWRLTAPLSPAPAPPPGTPCSVAELVSQYGFGDGKQWLKRWEKAWQANLNTCTLDGDCVIQLS